MNTDTPQSREITVPGFLNWLRGFNKRTTNRLTMRFAGKHVYAVIHHQERKSGKAYQTPVLAMAWGDSFIIPLPYGTQVDWYRNLMAVGECRMQWHDRFYTLRNPKLITPEEARPAFPDWNFKLLKQTQVYLKLERASAPELSPEQPMRRVLVYGAGVLGSLYAGKLHQAGYNVTLLARGQRLAELREHGLLLVEDGSESLERFPIQVTDKLGPEDAYDLVLVIVRKNQLESVLPPLAANQHTPNVLFLVNNAEGPEPLIQALSRERVLLGFPGAGGQRVDGVVRYRLASGIQPTTIGELDGRRSERLEHIARAFRDAELPVAVSEHIDAWLKTHVALVSPIANALYLAGGSNYRLANTRDGLVLLVRAVKEGLGVLCSLDIPITPAKYRALTWLPEPLMVAVLHKSLATPRAELVMARHANAARDEMLILADEFRALAKQSGVPTPAIDALYCYLDPAIPPVSEGQASLKLVWGPMIAMTGALVSAGALAGWLLWQRSRSVQHNGGHR